MKIKKMKQKTKSNLINGILEKKEFHDKIESNQDQEEYNFLLHSNPIIKA